MADFNSTRIDPRERLMTVGNQLLDVIYEMDATETIRTELLAASRSDDKDAFGSMMKAPGAMEAVLKGLTDGVKRESLVREYVTLRQTIEALTEPRTEVES